MYYGPFDSHLRYGNQTWGQKQSKTVEVIEMTQNEVL